MRQSLSNWLDIFSRYGVIILALATIFLFWNQTTDFFDTPKFIFLSAFVVILLILYIGSLLTEGKITFNKTPFDIPLLIILLTALASTFLSPSVNTSIFGNLARVHGSLMSIVVYILLYFTLVNTLKKTSDSKHLLNVLLLSAVVLSTLSIAYYFGLKLPFKFVQAASFTPTGSAFSTNALLILMLPFLVIKIVKEHLPQKAVLTALLGLFLITVGLTGSMMVYIAAALTLALCLQSVRAEQKSLPFLIAPLVIAVLITVLSMIAPVGSNKNVLYNLYQSYPREATLSFPTSWKIAVSTFRDFPILGSGPSTHLFNFTAYKPIEHNEDKNWNLRYDSPFNEYLGFLATLGGLGVLGLLFLTYLYLSLAFKTIFHSGLADEQGQLNRIIALGGVGFFILLAVHSSTLLLWVLGLLFLAMFLSVNRQLTQSSVLKTESLAPNGFRLNLDVIPMMMMMALLVVIGMGLFFVGKFALADYHHRQALTAVSQNNGLLAYNELVAAENINSKMDLYRSDLAQTNLALANAIAASKGPTESSPSGSLTDADKQNIQQLLSQAISEGRMATSLSPKNVINWEVLGSIYRQISGVASNGLQFALDSYGRAIQLDPLNPNLRLTVGGIYYSIKNYDLAIRFFTDAVNLKPNLPNAYYNLSVVLRDKGDLQNSQAMAEKLMSLLKPDSPDYQTAAKFLADLKAKIATGAAQINQPTSPLQNTKLPKVLDLPQPENIATPPAVKSGPTGN